MRNAVLMVFRISIFRRTFAAETLVIIGVQVLGGELWFN